MRHIRKAWAHWGREFVILVAAEHGAPIIIAIMMHWFGVVVVH